MSKKTYSNPITFNIDFDGTCTSHEFPKVGNDIGAQRVLKKLTDAGHLLILFTMRSNRAEKADPVTAGIQDVTGQFLTEAIQWFRDNDIPLHGIQTNPTQLNWTTSPKSYAKFMIDDSSIGCPLKTDLSISKKPFVDWLEVEKLLIGMNLIK